jgi:hypothetical protein
MTHDGNLPVTILSVLYMPENSGREVTDEHPSTG